MKKAWDEAIRDKRRATRSPLHRQGERAIVLVGGPCARSGQDEKWVGTRDSYKRLGYDVVYPGVEARGPLSPTGHP